MISKPISEVEELVMLAVGALEPNAYAYALCQELKEQSKRKLSLASVHTILYRLEKKGLLASKLGGQTQKRGGRSKRLFGLTKTGLQIIKEAHSVRNKLWGRIATSRGIG